MAGANNSMSTAIYMPFVPAVKKGTMIAASDGALTGSVNDWYRFTVPSNGYVSVTLSHESVHGSSWSVDVVDANSNSVADRFYSFVSTLTTTGPTFGLGAGTYYVKVSGGPTDPYTLTVHFTASSNWETQGHSSVATAFPIGVNTAVNGSLVGGHWGNNHYYKFTVPSNGYVSLTLAHAVAFGSSWSVDVVDANSNSVADRFYSFVSAVTTTGPTFGLGAGTYYVKVGGGPADPYTLTVNYTIRAGGSDRYATAVAVSQEGWTSSETVYLAYGWNFPDALAGVSLAAVNNAPILLTDTKSVPASTMARLKALGAKNVVLLGGTGVISTAVESQLKAAKYTVSRVAGTDRYDTAAQIGAKVLAKAPGSTAVLATGTEPADALSISPVAGMKGWPVVFATATGLPAATSAFVKSNKIKTVYIVGGAGVVGSGVEAQLKALGVTSVIRLAGTDRYDTSAKVATQFKASFTSSVSVATGTEFADALTGGVLSAKLKIPMLLLDPSKGASPGEKAYAKALTAPKVYVYGGTGALSDAVVRTLLS